MAYLWAFPFLSLFYFLIKPGFSGKWFAYLLMLAVGVLMVLTVTRFFIKIELVMDRERQQLLLRRRVFFFKQLVSLAGVEELAAVVTAGEVPAAPVNYWWDYVTVLLTKSGQRFRAARHGADFNVAQVATRELGEHLGIPVWSSQEGCKMKVHMGPSGPEARFEKFPLKMMDCLTVVFWGLMVFVSPFCFAALLVQ